MRRLLTFFLLIFTCFIVRIGTAAGIPQDFDYTSKDEKPDSAPLLVDTPAHPKPPDSLDWREIQTSYLLPDGDSFSTDVLQGKVVLLDYWATWCKPCLKNQPLVDSLARSIKSPDFQLVTISIDKAKRNGTSNWQIFMKDRDWPGIHILLNEGEANPLQHLIYQERYIGSQLTYSAKVPTYYLVGRNGYIREIDIKSEEVEQQIRRLLE